MNDVEKLSRAENFTTRTKCLYLAALCSNAPFIKLFLQGAKGVYRKFRTQ